MSFAYAGTIRGPRTLYTIETGRFVECGGEFVLEDEIDPYRFARLRVPGCCS